MAKETPGQRPNETLFQARERSDQTSVQSDKDTSSSLRDLHEGELIGQKRQFIHEREKETAARHHDGIHNPRNQEMQWASQHAKEQEVHSMRENINSNSDYTKDRDILVEMQAVRLLAVDQAIGQIWDDHLRRHGLDQVDPREEPRPEKAEPTRPDETTPAPEESKNTPDKRDSFQPLPGESEDAAKARRDSINAVPRQAENLTKDEIKPRFDPLPGESDASAQNRNDNSKPPPKIDDDWPPR